MSEEFTKFGAGSLKAMLRSGFKELGQALPAFPDSIQVVEEPGLPGNLTPQEVAAQKQSEREPEMEM